MSQRYRRLTGLGATLLLALASALLLADVQAEPLQRRMVVTLDDLPFNSGRQRSDGELERFTRQLAGALSDAGVPAIGFVNEGKLFEAGRLVPARAALLDRWLDAGLDLGNHGYSHLDLHRTPVDVYLADLARGERITRERLLRRDRELRFFRHPFLHTGRDVETREAVEAFLAARGQRVASVTIDNSEWIFARAYEQAQTQGDPGLPRRVREAYLDYMEAVVAYYEQQSRALLGYELPQILLLHANALNAEALPALLERLAKRGYAFIPLEEALADPAYAHEDEYRGPAGITWLHRWALTEGHRGDFFAGEPQCPESIQALAGIRE